MEDAFIDTVGDVIRYGVCLRLLKYVVKADQRLGNPHPEIHNLRQLLVQSEELLIDAISTRMEPIRWGRVQRRLKYISKRVKKVYINARDNNSLLEFEQLMMELIYQFLRQLRHPSPDEVTLVERVIHSINTGSIDRGSRVMLQQQIQDYGVFPI